MHHPPRVDSDRVASRPIGLYGIQAGAARLIDEIVLGWSTWFTVGLVVFAALPLAAPILEAANLGELGRSLRWLYSYTCHQNPETSWWLLGRPIAVCQRDTAIYLSMVATAILYQWGPYRFPRLSLWAYAALCVPIALDGGAATLGIRDSNPLLRTLTGALFGGGTIWFVYPLMTRSLAELAAFERAPTKETEL